MPIPFEALLPYGIMIVMFGATGTGLAAIRTWQNDNKMPRYSLDQWDKVRDSQTLLDAFNADANDKIQQMMERDRRLTGSLRGQTDKAVAPPGFEVNNPWKLEKGF